MNNKQKRTLKAIFSNPVSPSIAWKDIEKLLIAAGCNIEEGRGSRVRIINGDIFAVFHRPQPSKETDRGAVVSVREYLLKIGVKP